MIGILAGVAEKFAAFALEHALPLVVRHLPDVAKALGVAADAGELEEATADVVRRTLPAESESSAVLRRAGK